MANTEMQRWFPKGASIKEFPEAGLVVGYVNRYEAEPDKIQVAAPFWAIGYFGKAQRPSFNYTFRSEERMQAFIEERRAAGVASQKYKAEQAAARKAKLAAPNPLQVGDILRNSWGYEQTNVNYYQVVELVGKRSVKIREIASRQVEGSEQSTMSCYVKPCPGEFLEKAPVQLKRVGPEGDVKVHEWGSWARKVSPDEKSYCSWYA